MKLLEETIRELKGEDLDDDVRAAVNLKVDFRIDESYVAGHEPAAVDLPPGGRGAHRGRDRPGARRGARPLRRAAAGACSTWPTTAGSGCWPTGSALESIDRDGSLVVFKFRERTQVDVGPAAHAGPRPARPAARAAGQPQARPAARPGRGRGRRRSSRGLVDGPGHRRDGHAGILEGRARAPGARGSAGRRRAARPGARACCWPSRTTGGRSGSADRPSGRRSRLVS